MPKIKLRKTWFLEEDYQTESTQTDWFLAQNLADRYNIFIALHCRLNKFNDNTWSACASVCVIYISVTIAI